MVLNILVRHTIVSHAPWPSHTLCFFFSVVLYFAVLGVYGGMGMWVWLVFIRMLYDVVVRCSFLRLVLSLWRPPSQHTWFPHLRMCSGGNVGCMGS